MEGRLTRGVRIAVATAALLVAGGGVARAFILLPETDKDAIGNRNDVYAQSSKFSQCIVKALQKCEKGQDPTTPQCLLTGSTTNPTTLFTGVDPNTPKIADKFEADVQKCISKVDYSKKGAKDGTPTSKYEAIGCPGDCDDVTAGDQRCTDMSQYQDSSLEGTLDTVNLLGAAIPALAIQQPPPAVDPAGCVPPSNVDPAIFAKEAKAFDKCITNAVSVVAKFAAAVQKCIAGCEADYKDKKGNGGPTDGPPTCNLAAIDNMNPDAFGACYLKALEKANKKPLPAGIGGALGLVGCALDPATNGLFNVPGGNCGP